MMRGLPGTFLLVALIFATPVSAFAQNWPQWLGPGRNAQATAFQAPATWPAQLKQVWKKEIGNGATSPTIVEGRLYVLGRVGSNEVVRCLNAENGEQIWESTYATGPAEGAGGRIFPGPRATPAVANGKVVTFSVHGTISCLNAENGQVVWRNEKYNGNAPQFSTSSSPIIIDDAAIVQVGGERGGAVAAFDLNSGNEKWKWEGDGSAYSSPTMIQLNGAPVLIAETTSKIVGLNPTNGSQLWVTDFPVSGRGYNASTPVVHNDLLIYAGSGRGVQVVRLKKDGDQVTAEKVWSNPGNSVQYNTPVVANGHVIGFDANDVLFSINLETGMTEWTNQLPRASNRGYGTLVSLGNVVFATNPNSTLYVVAATGEAYKELASYKVSDGDAYGVPVAVGNRIYIRDVNNLTCWSLE